MRPEFIPYEHNDLIKNGKVVTFDMEMSTYPDLRRRTIRVWTPDSYDGVKRFPVLYMHDGQSVFAAPNGQQAQDVDRAVVSLEKEGISCIIVAIDYSPDRGAELTPPYPRGVAGATINGHRTPIIPGPSTTDLYAEFVVKYLKPVIDENFMTLTDPMNTCVAGVSAGGSASFYMMLRNPEIFGRAIVCSPGFPMFDLEKFLAELDAYDFTKLADHRIAFYNGDQGIDRTSVDYVLAVYRLFKAKGMDRLQNMFVLDTRQAHYNGAWARYFPDLIRFAFAEDNGEKQND